MITVVGIWEPGFSKMEQCIEYRMWKQTIAAFNVDRWIMLGEPPDPKITAFERAPSLEDALETCPDQHIFLIPGDYPDISEFPAHYRGDATVIFGNVTHDLRAWVMPDDLVFNIETARPVDMFAAACLPLVLRYATD